MVVHCCARAPPVATGASRRGGLSLDLTDAARSLEDELGEAVEGGVGCSPASSRRCPTAPVAVGPGGYGRARAALWRRLGLPAEALREVVVTPTCGLAGASPEHARAALRLAARRPQLAEDPEG